MALSRAKKTEKVKQLASELEASTSAIIGTFSAMTASKDFDLRKIVRAAGGSYHVVKNKLAAKASQGTRIEGALQGLKGVSSVAYTSGDPVALAKALSVWVKDNAEFTFKLGIVDGKVITVDEVNALATMPGKEELYAKLLFLIQSPAQRLATVINATGRDLAVVINQGVEKGEFSTAPVSASAPVAVASAETTADEPVAPAASVQEDPAADGSLIADAHAAEVPGQVETLPSAADQIAANPASEADPVTESQPENGTASQAGEAATTEPVEG